MTMVVSTFQTEIIQQMSKSVLTSYGKPKSDCVSRVDDRMVSFLCDQQLMFGFHGLMVNQTEFEGSEDASRDKFALFDNTVVTIRMTKKRDHEAALIINKIDPRGAGENPSSNRKSTINLMINRVVDANIYNVKADSTTYLFIPMIALEGELGPDQPRLRRYFDPFSNRRVLQSDDQLSRKQRILAIFVVDNFSFRAIKVSEIDLTSFEFTEWPKISVSFLSRLPDNRLAFELIADQNRKILISTVKNSMRFQIVQVLPIVTPISSVITNSGYIYYLRGNSIQISKISQEKLKLIMMENHLGEDYLISRQTIQIPSRMVDRPKQFKLFETMDGLPSMLILSSDKEIIIYSSYLGSVDYDNETNKMKLLKSKYSENLRKVFNEKVLGYHLTYKNSKEEKASKGLFSPKELLVIVKDGDEIIKYTIPLCSPYFTLEVVISDEPVCKNQALDHEFTLGFQNNEIKSCNAQQSEYDIPRAFLCRNYPQMIANALEQDEVLLENQKIQCKPQEALPSPKIDHETNSNTGTAPAKDEAKDTSCFFDQNPKLTNCSLLTDCYNCSMVNLCSWESANDTCVPLSFGDTTSANDSLKRFKVFMLDVGTYYSDVASLKILKDCNPRKDMKFERYQDKGYFNLSLTPPNGESSIIVVSF